MPSQEHARFFAQKRVLEGMVLHMILSSGPASFFRQFSTVTTIHLLLLLLKLTLMLLVQNSEYIVDIQPSKRLSSVRLPGYHKLDLYSDCWSSRTAKMDFSNLTCLLFVRSEHYTGFSREAEAQSSR